MVEIYEHKHCTHSCFCTGPQNGDPHCPCRMRSMGLKMNEPFDLDKAFDNALKKSTKQVHPKKPKWIAHTTGEMPKRLTLDTIYR